MIEILSRACYSYDNSNECLSNAHCNWTCANDRTNDEETGVQEQTDDCETPECYAGPESVGPALTMCKAFAGSEINCNRFADTLGCVWGCQ